MSDAHWPAPFRGRTPVHAQVTIPGSKSVTNRALILASLATSPSTIRKPLISRDSELMSAGLSALRISITGSDEAWQITPAPLRGPVRRLGKPAARGGGGPRRRARADDPRAAAA